MGLEIKCAVRSLLRSPVYSVAVALTVALCLALSWTVYVEVGPALVGQLPFARQPGRLVSIGEIAPSRTVADPVAPADFELLHGLRTLSAVAAYASGPGIAFTLTGRGAPRRYQGCVVSGKFFQVMQARAALGRLLAPPDNLPAAAPAVVLSHRLWVRRFGASPAILGQGVDLNGIRYEVVGVARGGAAYPPGTDIWVSKLRYAYRAMDIGEIEIPSYSVIGRMRGWARLRQVRAEVGSLHPTGTSGHGDRRFEVESLRNALYGRLRGPFAIAWAVALGLLLLGCANLANLAATRWEARRSDLAVRAALGAGLGGLLRPAVYEVLLLVAAGAAAAVLPCYWCVRALGDVASARPAAFPAGVLGAFWYLVLLIGAVFLAVVVLPDIQSRRRLARDYRALEATSRRARGDVLVAGQVALALALVTYGGLAIVGLARLLRIPTGLAVPPAHLIVADLQLPASVYPSAARQDAVFDRLLARVKALPGVTSAAWASSVPVRDGAFELPIRTRRGSGDSVVMVDCFVVTREYFAALGIPLRAGRGWEGDGDRGVILDRAALALLSPGRSALGRSLLVSFRAPGSGARSWRPVIGLAGSVAVRGGAGRHPEVYVQFRGFPVPFSERVLVVRSAAGSALAPSLRALAARLAPEAPLRRVQTLRAVLAGQTSSERFSALAMGWVGAAGLLLALLGVYALAAYRVQSRRNELAVRAALGASPRRLRLLVAGQAVRWSTWGTGVGLLI